MCKSQAREANGPLLAASSMKGLPSTGDLPESQGSVYPWWRQPASRRTESFYSACLINVLNKIALRSSESTFVFSVELKEMGSCGFCYSGTELIQCI